MMVVLVVVGLFFHTILTLHPEIIILVNHQGRKIKLRNIDVLDHF